MFSSRTVRVIFHVLLSTRSCSVRASTSVRPLAEDTTGKLVNRAFKAQPFDLTDLDKTTLGKHQEPGISGTLSNRDSNQKSLQAESHTEKKALTNESKASIVLAAVAGCMGFLLICVKINAWFERWSSAEAGLKESLLNPSQDKTIMCDSGPLPSSVPISLSPTSLVGSNPLQPAADKPAYQTSASVCVEQCQQNEYKQPIMEQHLAAIEGYTAQEVVPMEDILLESPKDIAEQNRFRRVEFADSPNAAKPDSSMTASSDFVARHSGKIAMHQAQYGQLSQLQSLKQNPIIQPVRQTSAGAPSITQSVRQTSVGAPSITQSVRQMSVGSPRVISVLSPSRSQVRVSTPNSSIRSHSEPPDRVLNGKFKSQPDLPDFAELANSPLATIAVTSTANTSILSTQAHYRQNFQPFERVSIPQPVRQTSAGTLKAITQPVRQTTGGVLGVTSQVLRASPSQSQMRRAQVRTMPF